MLVYEEDYRHEARRQDCEMAFTGRTALSFYLSNSALGLEDAVRRANHIASVSVQGEGTQSSYPERSALPAELFAGI